MTRILIDADACPVWRDAEAVAQRYSIPVTLLCDESHILRSEMSQVRVISSGADAVDIALMNLCRRGDLVITQDYGLAAMVLGKGAYAMHHSGREYTHDNIEMMLMERHLAKKARRASSKHHLRGPAKFTAADRRHFIAQMTRLVEHILTQEG